jgi:hypothetical protein
LFRYWSTPARFHQSYCWLSDCGRSLLARSGLSGCGAPLSKIELMKDDAAAVLKMGEEIKARYTKIFRV